MKKLKCWPMLSKWAVSGNLNSRLPTEIDILGHICKNRKYTHIRTSGLFCAKKNSLHCAYWSVDMFNNRESSLFFCNPKKLHINTVAFRGIKRERIFDFLCCHRLGKGKKSATVRDRDISSLTDLHTGDVLRGYVLSSSGRVFVT